MPASLAATACWPIWRPRPCARWSTSTWSGRSCARGRRCAASAPPGRQGAIVSLSSIAAQTGSPGEYVHYAATKGAIESFTVGLGRELAAEGIRVNAVAPGMIRTGIHAPGRLERVTARIPAGRPGEPEEIAEAVAWLLSDAARYTTATVLKVAGGI